MPENPSTRAVFLSYASQDATAAKRICEALLAAGVEVWFDQSALVGGDAWDQSIRKQIGDCALFIPVFSASTQSRREAYFRLEWKLADERTHLMAEGTPFLLPVSIDRTTEQGALVPKSFLAVQWTKLPDGETPPAFIDRVKKLLGATSTTDTSRPRPVQREGSVAPTINRKPTFPVRLWATLTVVLVGIAVGILLLRKNQAETPVALVPPDQIPSAPSRALSPTPQVDAKSIAVLPFENMSDDKENTSFFSDGMHEDILTNLANIRDLRVVSRTSVMEYRGTTKKIPQIARELGVAYILEGSVRRSGNQVRITGQLIRAATDEHLWAKSYDRELTPKEMFAIQAALSTEIAGALQAVISPETRALLERRPTDNLQAYDLYLKARSYYSGEIGFAERIKLLEAAVELDPNFAEAWGQIAVLHANYIHLDIDHTPARLSQADAAMARAVRLAPSSPEVMRLLGHYTYWGYRDYPRAIAQFEKVLQLQPNNAGAMTSLGVVQRRQGLWLGSLENLRRAVALDPGNITAASELSSTLIAGRNWDELIMLQRKLVALQPDRLNVRFRLVRTVFAATGSTKEADEWLARMTPLQLDDPTAIAFRQWRAIVQGNHAEWKRLDAIQPFWEDDREQRWNQVVDSAMVLAAQGDLAAARARLGNFPQEVRSMLAQQPTNATMWSRLGLMEALLGQKEEALRDAGKAIELRGESLDAVFGPDYSRNLASVYAWNGDKDRAIAELERLVHVPNGVRSVHELRVDPAFAPLRERSDFQTLLNDPKNNLPLF